MLKLTTDRHEALRGLFATAELLVERPFKTDAGGLYGLCRKTLCRTVFEMMAAKEKRCPFSALLADHWGDRYQNAKCTVGAKNTCRCFIRDSTVYTRTTCCESDVSIKKYLHRVQKKRCHWFFCCNFYKYWRIFIISHAQLHKRMPKSCHTFVMLLPYHVKVSDTKVTHFTQY